MLIDAALNEGRQAAFAEILKNPTCKACFLNREHQQKFFIFYLRAAARSGNKEVLDDLIQQSKCTESEIMKAILDDTYGIEFKSSPISFLNDEQYEGLASINFEEEQGMDAIRLAVQSGQVPAVDLLLSRCMKNKEKKEVKEILEQSLYDAIRDNHTNVVMYLTQKIGKEAMSEVKINHARARDKNIALLRCLQENGAQFDKDAQAIFQKKNGTVVKPANSWFSLFKSIKKSTDPQHGNKNSNKMQPKG